MRLIEARIGELAEKEKKASGGRIHQTLRMTPAMKAGGTLKLWEIEDILELLD